MPAIDVREYVGERRAGCLDPRLASHRVSQDTRQPNGHRHVITPT
jgi:hypothetical protein